MTFSTMHQTLRASPVNLKFNNSVDFCFKEFGCGLKTLKELKEAIKKVNEKQQKEKLLMEVGRILKPTIEIRVNGEIYNEA